MVDHVQRVFRADVPTRVWPPDVTEHRTRTGGNLYSCAIKDVFSRRIAGYSSSDCLTERIAVDVLRVKRADIRFHDPHVFTWHLTEGDLRSETDLDAAVAEADVVVLLQNHRSYDVDALAEAARLFFDTRGITGRRQDVHRL